MNTTTRALGAFALTLPLMACGGSDATFAKGCKALVHAEKGAYAALPGDFCPCLIDRTADLSADEKMALGKVMLGFEQGGNLRAALEEAIAEGTITDQGGRVFFTGVASCSLGLAL